MDMLLPRKCSGTGDQASGLLCPALSFSKTIISEIHQHFIKRNANLVTNLPKNTVKQSEVSKNAVTSLPQGDNVALPGSQRVVQTAQFQAGRNRANIITGPGGGVAGGGLLVREERWHRAKRAEGI